LHHQLLFAPGFLLYIYQVSGIYPFKWVIFKGGEFTLTYVADRTVPLVDSAASNSNSKFPAKLMIYPDNYYNFSKEKYTLLPQRTFDSLLNRTHKEK
jgi:hypothetical protein